MQLSRPVAALLTLVALALGGLALWRLDVTTEITEFLPPAEDARLDGLLRSVARSDLNRTISLSVEAPDEDTASAAARELSERLAGHADVQWVRSGPAPGLNRAFYEAYFPRRFALAEVDFATLTDADFDEGAVRLRSQLASLAGPFLRQLAPEDPLLLFPARLDALAAAQRGGLDVHDGAFVSADRRHGVVLLATRASPFDTVAGRRVERAIAEAFDAVNHAHGGALRLEQASVHRIAISSEAGVKADVTRVGALGSAGVVLLLLLLFRSPRWLLLGNLPIAVGVAAAFVASEFVFGGLHGLTLAFGATLVGVSLDYVAHFFAHQALAPEPSGPAATMRTLRPGLAVGALTTVAGLLGLAWTGFAGIAQMALFSSVGVLAALVATLTLVTPWLRSTPPSAGRLLRAFSRVGARLLAPSGQRVLLGLAALLVVAAAVGFSRLSFSDSLASLATGDPALKAEDERVRERVARMDAGRFVVAFGGDLEQALERTEAALPILEQAEARGEVTRHQAVTTLLPSLRRQRASLASLASAHELGPRVLAALERAGFRVELFAPFEAAIGEATRAASGVADPGEALLRLDDLRGTPLMELVTPFLVEVDGGVAVLTFVRGVRDPAALDAALSPVEGVRLFDQGRLMASASGLLRERTQQMLLAGLGVVFLLLLVRYRQPRTALAALLPAVVAGAVTVGLLGLFGVPLTLLHVVALLLVLSMGVDYSVFMVESAGSSGAGAEATVAGLLVACVSTLISFGSLAFSAQPALAAMGVTVAVGVGTSVLLAPLAPRLMSRSRRA